MPFLILLPLLLPLPLALAHRLNRRFEEIVPLCWSSLVVIACLLGMAGVLGAAPVLFLAAAGGSAVYLVWALLRQKNGAARRDFLKNLLGPGFWLFVLGAAFLWWISRGHRYANWDEYSHWGRALKAMVGQDLLPALAAGKDRYREYPPGPALFQYLLMRASGLGFREDVAIFLQNIFALGFLLYPIGFVRKKAALPAAALALFAAPLAVYPAFYAETTVDGLLGVQFAVLLMVWLWGRGKLPELVMLCTQSFCLALTKSSGTAFAVMAVAVAAVTVLVQRKNAKLLGVQGRQIVLWLLAPPAAAFAASKSWSLFLRVHQVPLRWSPEGLTAGALLDLFRGRPQWRLDTIHYFGWNIFCDTNYGSVVHMPYAALVAVLALLALGLCLLLPKAWKKRGRAVLLGAAACTVLYTAATLFTYLFWFDPAEATILASLSRYLNTGLTALLVVLAGALGPVLEERRPRAAALAAAGSAAVWLLITSPSPVPILTNLCHAPLAAAATQNQQRAYTQAAQRIGALYSGQQELPVYVVAQRDYGLTTIKLDYELHPAHLPEHTSSIGSPYEEGDLWTAPFTAQTWAQELAENYEYVYLFQVDDKFTAEFGSLFPEGSIQNGNLFRVIPTRDGVQLELIPAA